MSGDEPPGPSTTDRLLIELTRTFEPLFEVAEATAAGDRVPLYRLCESLGIDVDDDAIEDDLESIETAIEALEDTYATLEGVTSAIDDGLDDELDLDLDDFAALSDGITDVLDAFRDLEDVSVPTPAGEIESIGTALFDYLLTEYLDRHHPEIADGLEILGVLERTDPVPTVDFSRLPEALEDPQEAIAAAVQWGAEEGELFEPMVLLYYLRSVAWEFDRPSQFVTTDDDVVDVLDDDDTGVEDYARDDRSSMLDVRLLTLVLDGGVRTDAGVQFVPVPRGDDRLPGIAALPYGNLEAGFDQDLGEGWQFGYDSSGAFDEWGAVAFPDEAPRAIGDSSGDFHGEVGVTRQGADSGDELTLLGDDGGSRVGLTSIEVTALVHYDGDEISVGVELPVTGTIAVDPDGFDGFVSSILPSDGIQYDFALVVGWSSTTGFYFENGGTLEAAIPQNADVGPVSMDEIYVSALPEGVTDGDEDPGVTLSAAASASVELGPLVGSVQRMGIQAQLSFPEDGDGAFGPVDLELGVDPPDGIGLAIDAEGVSGGGFLELDHENDRYAGAVQLHVGELTFNAVGLLTTQLPNGEDGFSLLILVTAEFPPIELGLGFTLEGLGGLVGIHRRQRTDPLKRAVRDGSLDSVLFPEDVVENAPRIVSDLRETFPATADYHVFGPMARLGWGTPTLITADLGVLLEFPSLRISLLGRIGALLPDEAAPLVEINAGVFGLIDPAVPELELHASLYDSRVLAWDISGDFGLLIRGGDDPDFLLSAGGFHPQYEPPGSFADMRRLRASLGPPGGNPALELKGYFAVTSNTVQAGANCSLFGEFGPASVDGELGFDALVQFDPFEFIVDIIASLTVKALGTSFSVSLEGSLAGPAPWHVDGELEVSVAFVSVSVHVDATFGEEDDRDALPPADVMSELTQALSRPGNWRASNPVGGESPVTLREREGGDDDPEDAPVSIHPMGELAVRQTVVPLGVEIDAFGNATPKDSTRFDVLETAETNAGSTLARGDGTEEQFAPAEYFDLSDDDSLDSPAFEPMVAGYRFGPDGAFAGGDPDGDPTEDENALAANARRTDLGYETSIRDELCDNYGLELAEVAGIEVAVGAVPAGVAQQTTRAAVGRDVLGCEDGPAPDELVDEGTTPSESSLEGAFGGASTTRRYRIVRSDTFEPVDLAGEGRTEYTKAEAKRTIDRHADPATADRYQVVAAEEVHA
ncbi:DUF6603 domain-containing protein [Natrarchaeobius sp. A-rgal3]|uniref:DUF6603 domain-containing protein n=1 Tax=Natrarchaeobius versutus TaxID=1679078 RepID=UPI00350F501D